jgi:hypothetical protein
VRVIGAQTHPKHITQVKVSGDAVALGRVLFDCLSYNPDAPIDRLISHFVEILQHRYVIEIDVEACSRVTQSRDCAHVESRNLFYFRSTADKSPSLRVVYQQAVAVESDVPISKTHIRSNDLCHARHTTNA